MKRKNLALRMSAYMMSALLVVGSAAPTYVAEEVTFADEATDIAVEDAGEGETEVTEDDFADLDLEGDGSDETGDSADLFTDEAGENTGDQTGIDTSALEATIAKADALDEMTYTKASWDGNKDAIETAKTAAKAALAAKESQEAVDAANTALTSAMGKLVAAGDQTKLKKVLAEAEALKEEDYTADSWKAANLAKKIMAAQDVVDSRAKKEEVKGAVNDLTTAMSKLVAVSAEITVGRGDFQQKLTPGTYSLPIELLNAGRIEASKEFTTSDYMKQTSMAAGCFTGDATLVIHEDGTATLTTGLGAVSSDALGTAQSGGADDWTIYEDTQAFLNGAANSITGVRFKARIDKQGILGGKRKPTKISFTVPDLKQNVVATRMHIEIMGVYQDACIGLDWTNIKKVSDETSATSTVEKTYDVAPDVQTQLQNMKAGSSVKLDTDITLTDDLTIKGGTLDLNGHTLDQADDNLIRIKGDVTVIDSSADKTGKIVGAAYSSGYNTTTTISVEKGSLTADGVTIYGQIGNAVSYNSTFYISGIPHISVTLTNSNLIYNGSNMYAISFQGLAEGINLKIDKTALSNKGIYLVGCTNVNASITNSEMSVYNQMGSKGNNSLTFTGNTSAGVTTDADTLTMQDDTIKGSLTLNGKGEAILENLNVTSTASKNGALKIEGSISVTIKSGVYTSTGKKAYTIEANGYPVAIEGGYFKGVKGIVNNLAYTIPSGKTFGEVTEGEYAGYQTLVDGSVEEVTDPVATIYNEDGTVAVKLPEEKAGLATAFAKDGQTVKLNKDINIEEYETYYKNITLDLNGHTLNAPQGLQGSQGTCHVIDSSADKSGKLVASAMAFWAISNSNATAIFDGITCETGMIQYFSVGKLYIVNGTKIIGTSVVDGEGDGSIYIQDSTWKFADKDAAGKDIDGKALLENTVRTAQYAITENADGSFTMTVTDFGKAMRAFEALDSSVYTKASYKAAKDLYDEINVTVDEDLTEEQIKGFQDAIAALQAVASESDIAALKGAITAAKAVNASDYTAASYKTLSDAVAAAEALLSGEDMAQADVTAAVQAINDATAGLVKVQAQTITISVKNSKDTVSKKFGDKAFSLGAKAKGGLTYKSSNTKIATVDSKGKVTIKAAGTVKITITAKATSDYKSATKTVTVKVARIAPSIKTKTGSKTFKYATVKKKAQTFTLGASTNSKGKLTFKKLSKTSAVALSSTGKLTVKKGLKKGTYKVKIKISAAAKGNYNAGSKTVTVTVKVK